MSVITTRGQGKIVDPELAAGRSGAVPRGPAQPTDRAAADVEAMIRAFAAGEHRRVVATVSLWATSTDVAAEAVIDALASAWERMDRGESIVNLAAWVTRVAVNAVHSAHRHQAVRVRTRHLVAVSEHSDDPSPGTVERVDLVRALAHLSDRQREVLALHYALDLPVAAVAAQLGLAEGTVKATLHQARSRLAEILTIPTTEEPS